MMNKTDKLNMLLDQVLTQLNLFSSGGSRGSVVLPLGVMEGDRLEFAVEVSNLIDKVRFKSGILVNNQDELNATTSEFGKLYHQRTKQS